MHAALRTLADSPIIRKPRQTIALGILTALLYYTAICLLLAAVVAWLRSGTPYQ